MKSNVINGKKLTGWGLWVSAPHCGLHLDMMYSTKKAALAAARQKLEKNWADYIEVRKVTLGKTIVELKHES